MEESFEAVINEAFTLLNESVDIIKDVDSGTPPLSLFYSHHEKSLQDELNLYELGKIDLLRSRIEKLHDISSSLHPEANTVSEAVFIIKRNSDMKYGEIRQPDTFNYWNPFTIEEIEKNSLIYNDKDKKLKLAIIDACHSCCESFITVNSMIKAYNSDIHKEIEANEDKIKDSKYPDLIKKVEAFVIIKEIQLPESLNRILKERLYEKKSFAQS